MNEARVDAPPPPIYVGRAQPGAALLLCALAMGSLLAGCTAGRGGERPLAVPPSEVEAQLREATRPAAPIRLVFRWQLNERGSRLEGRGVARIEPPYRARLDLFTDNGETAARVALVDSDLRVPPGVDHRLIPPPALLWASLGVFHPATGAALLGGEAYDGGEIGLRYRLVDGREGRFFARGDTTLLEAELLDGGRAVERVTLEWDEGPFPEGAVYRELSAFRELRVTLESSEHVESFSGEIWEIGG